MKFDSICALLKDYPGQYLYKDLRLSIKLWLNKESREELAQDKLVKKSIKIESNTKMYKNKDLNH